MRCSTKLNLPRLSLLILLFLVAGMWAQAYAGQRYVEVNWESLELTGQQRNHLQDLDEQWKSTVSEIVPRLEDNRRKLRRLMKSPEADKTEIIRLQEKINADKTRLKIRAFQIFQDKRRILNRDQQEKLQKMLEMH